MFHVLFLTVIQPMAHQQQLHLIYCYFFHLLSDPLPSSLLLLFILLLLTNNNYNQTCKYHVKNYVYFSTRFPHAIFKRGVLSMPTHGLYGKFIHKDYLSGNKNRYGQNISFEMKKDCEFSLFSFLADTMPIFSYSSFFFLLF